jgi:IrrE N-terminal-like domain
VTRLTPAESLLQELGVTGPAEIDLEAIAFNVGARVRCRPLDGCEARIIGCDDAAIITVNQRSSYPRKRFSIAHELGHWRHHRGKALVCRAEEFRLRDPTSPERVADVYAADLLMPHYLFRPVARQHPKLTFKTVSALGGIFHTSQTATAIRLVESDHSPALLICHGKQSRKWFTRSPGVPTRWFPKDTLDADSFAFGVLYGSNSDDPMPRKIGADAWFDHWEAAKHDVYEQTIRTGEDESLTLVLITDVQMLEEQDERARGRYR